MKTAVPRAGTAALQDEIKSGNRSPTVTPLAPPNQGCRPRRGVAAANSSDCITEEAQRKSLMSQLPVRHYRARRIRVGKESAGTGVAWPASMSRSRGSSAEALEQAAERLLLGVKQTCR